MKCDLILKFSLILLLVNIFILHQNFAQNNNNSTNKKPTVGLVLSGGGSHGIAHIGLLKLLDSLNIQPDIIAGTSMGSLIGAMKAIGYTPEQMEEILNNIDWNYALSNAVPLRSISLEEKNEYNQTVIDLPFDFKKLYLPSGLNEGENIYSIFVKNTLPAINITKFDSLQIPFFCNATNAEIGKNRIFEEGYLPLRLRASMSVPSFFSPVEINDSLYTDGGVTNNFMLEEMKKRGVDIIISSYTGLILLNKDKLQSAMSILKQTASYMSYYNSIDQFKYADVIVFPDIKDISPTNFKPVDSLIALGKKSSDIRISQLDSIAKLVTPYPQKTNTHVPIIKDSDTINIGCITHNYLYHTSSAFVWAKLQLKENKKITIKELNDAIDRVRGSRYFTSVYYELIPENDGKLELQLKLKENPFGSLGFAPHFDNTYGAGVKINVISRNVLYRGSRIFASLDAAQSPAFRINFQSYFGLKQQFIIGADFLYRNTFLPVYDSVGIKKIQFDRNNFNGNLFGQIDVSSTFGFGTRVGVLRNYISPSSISPFDRFKKYNYTSTFQDLYLVHNSLDDHYFANKGNLANLNIRYIYTTNNEILYNQNYIPIDGDIFNSQFNFKNIVRYFFESKTYIPFSKKLNIAYELSSGGTLSRKINPFESFNLGGMEKFNESTFTMPGYNYSEIVAFNFVNTLLETRYKLTKNIYANASIGIGFYSSNYTDIFSLLNNADINYKNKVIKPMSGASIGASYKSRLGPIRVDISKNFYYGDVRFHLSFGYKFQ